MVHLNVADKFIQFLCHIEKGDILALEKAKDHEKFFHSLWPAKSNIKILIIVGITVAIEPDFYRCRRYCWQPQLLAHPHPPDSLSFHRWY